MILLAQLFIGLIVLFILTMVLWVGFCLVLQFLATLLEIEREG